MSTCSRSSTPTARSRRAGWPRRWRPSRRQTSSAGAPTPQPALPGWPRGWAAVEARQAHGSSYVWSQHLAIRADIFRKLGGFDETLTTAEDVDLSRRLLATGGRIQFVPRMAAVHHGFPASLAGSCAASAGTPAPSGGSRGCRPRAARLVLAACRLDALRHRRGRPDRPHTAAARPARRVGASAPPPASRRSAWSAAGRRAPACRTASCWGSGRAIRVARLPRELRARRGRHDRGGGRGHRPDA